MIFITLVKWKTVPEKELVDQGTKAIEELEKQGVKFRWYWTLGRYDAVTITEAPTERDVMKMLLPWVDIADTETMVAVPGKKQ